VVATYIIADSSGDPGDKWRAKVDWGDGSAQDKKVSPTAVGTSFEFLDSHAYASAGTYTVTLNIAAPGSHLPNDNTVTFTADIQTSPTLSSIAVTPANPSVPAGETQQFTATGTFSDGSTANGTDNVTWASGTTSVATISNTSGSQGLATAVAKGTSTISATLDGITGTTVLTVSPAVLQSIAVTPADPSVPKGETEQFTATGTFSDKSTENLTSQVTWASATTSVATITAAALATGMTTGTSTISATLNQIKGSTVLTVSPAALLSFAVTPANPSIAQGDTEQFTATGTFSDHSTQNVTSQVTWASSTPSVSTITAAGLASGVATGNSTISATIDGIILSTVLTVNSPPAPPLVTLTNVQRFLTSGTR
jgi:trimeric autotransporter adhesin